MGGGGSSSIPSLRRVSPCPDLRIICGTILGSGIGWVPDGGGERGGNGRGVVVGAEVAAEELWRWAEGGKRWEWRDGWYMVMERCEWWPRNGGGGRRGRKR